MSKTIKVTGTYPNLNFQSDIHINYVERLDGKFDKQRFSCSLIEKGVACNRTNKCPLYQNAPQIIN